MMNPEVILAELDKEFGPVVIPCILFHEDCKNEATWWLSHDCCSARWPCCSMHRLAFIQARSRELRTYQRKCSSCGQYYTSYSWTEYVR